MGTLLKRESAFAPFLAARRLEDMPTSCPGPFNVALQCSVGLKTVQGCASMYQASPYVCMINPSLS